MSDDFHTCPYCNAELPAGAHGRLTCPRCGEVVNLSSASRLVQEHPDVSLTLRSDSSANGLPVSQITPPANVKRSNRILAGIILSVMMLMAGTGLAFALKTVGVRRMHDTALPPRSRKVFERFRKKEPEIAERVAPIHLAGLGYLPAGVDLVSGIHVEELLSSPVGKDLAAKGFKIGSVELKLDALREQLGVDVQEIDHIVFGAKLGDGKEVNLTPSVTLVIRTRQPYDTERVRTALKASRPRTESAPGGETRSVYLITVRNFPVKLWLADEQTLVLGLFNKFENVPLKPREESSSLSAELRQVLEERLGAGFPVWLVGHSLDWSKTLLPTLLRGFKTIPLVSHLSKVNTFAIGLQIEKAVRLIGAFRCADETVAKRISERELAPQRKANPESFSYNLDKEWLSVQLTLPLDGAMP